MDTALNFQKNFREKCPGVGSEARCVGGDWIPSCFNWGQQLKNPVEAFKALRADSSGLTLFWNLRRK